MFIQQRFSHPLMKVGRHYPKLTLRLRAPIEVENLLPYDIKFRVYLKERERTYSAFLRKGGTSPLHIVDPLDLLLLGVEIEEEGAIGFKRSDYSIINTDSPEDLPLEYTLPMQDEDGHSLNLRIHYVRYPMSGGAFKVQIYSPYVVINKTGLDFGLQSRTSLGFTKPAAGLNLYSGASQCHVAPLPRSSSTPQIPNGESSPSRSCLPIQRTTLAIVHCCAWATRSGASRQARSPSSFPVTADFLSADQLRCRGR